MNEERSLHELLCAYVLREASPEERARVEAELERDEALRAERARLEATIGLVQETLGGDEALSEGAQAELMAKAGFGSAPGPRATSGATPLWSSPVFRMAAAALLLAGGVLLAREHLGRSAPAPETEVARGQERQKDGAQGLLSKADPAALDAAAGRARKAGPGEEIRPRVAGEGKEEGADPSVQPRTFGIGTRSFEVAEPVLEETEVADAVRRGLGSIGYAGGADESDRNAVEHERASETAVFDDAERWKKVGEDSALLYAGRAGVEPPAQRSRDLGQTPAAPSAVRGGQPEDANPNPPPGGAAPIAVGRNTTDVPAPLLSNVIYEVQAPVNSPRNGPDTQYYLASTSEEVSSLLSAYANGRDDRVRELLRSMRGADGESDVQRLSDVLIRECRRRPHESPSMMFFRYWGDNPFEYPVVDPLSTFSVDVDTASYALARNYLTRGAIPPKAAVRTEEFVNYFAPDVPAPLEGDFAIHTDLAPSRFGGGDPNRWMLRVVLRGREVSKEERAPLALTFVVDTSGSMQKENRMELVKHALRLLVAELDPNDSIALVAFSNEARLVLPMTSLANRAAVEVAINGLHPSGSTNAEAGLKLGYAIAAGGLHPSGQNRVVLLSDGVANVGQTDQERLGEDVAAFRKRGIYLNTIGVGMGNHSDVFLEQLADKGDGLCNYVDGEREAKRAIVDNFTGAFQPIARDVKVQVELDPGQVASYRLLGYENRAVRDRDFRNDAVDAGEVGAGHQVTALYELVRTGNADADGPLATVRLRWKPPHGAEVDDPEQATEIAHPVLASGAAGSFEQTPAGYRRAVLVAQFAELLRRSVHARGDSLDELIAEAQRLEPELADPDFSELTALLVRSREIVLRSLPRHDELTRALDAFRERECLIARYEELLAEDERDVLGELEEQNRLLEEKIRRLLEKRLGPQPAPEGAGRRR